MNIKIIINSERCKGCQLCISVCPKGCLFVSKKANDKSYFPIEAKAEGCIGCAKCAIVCPETAISTIVEI